MTDAVETVTLTLMEDQQVKLFRRPRSPFWQCSTWLSGRDIRASTKQKNIELAKEFAREWYLERRVDDRRRKQGTTSTSGEIALPARAELTTQRRRSPATGPAFKDVADAFIKEYQSLNEGEKNKTYIKNKGDHIRCHLNPFLGNKRMSEITAGLVQEYRVHRQTSRIDKRTGQPKRPAHSTLNSEIVVLRQVLQYANDHGMIDVVPNISERYKKSKKISHRAWFSPEEYNMLCDAARDRAANPPNKRWRKECEDMFDYILIMGNTGLRPDEANRLEERDVKIVEDEQTGKRILEIHVTMGKRGYGICKSMPNAVFPYERLKKRKNLKPTDHLFPYSQRELFNAILGELKLKTDRQGLQRTTYSLRHTYISMRLMNGADIYQIAKNCRTSVEMIEKFYAAHIRNMIDTSSINVVKTARRTNKDKKKTAADATSSQEAA